MKKNTKEIEEMLSAVEKTPPEREFAFNAGEGNTFRVRRRNVLTAALCTLAAIAAVAVAAVLLPSAPVIDTSGPDTSDIVDKPSVDGYLASAQTPSLLAVPWSEKGFSLSNLLRKRADALAETDGKTYDIASENIVLTLEPDVKISFSSDPFLLDTGDGTFFDVKTGEKFNLAEKILPLLESNDAVRADLVALYTEYIMNFGYTGEPSADVEADAADWYFRKKPFSELKYVKTETEFDGFYRDQVLDLEFFEYGANRRYCFFAVFGNMQFAHSLYGNGTAYGYFVYDFETDSIGELRSGRDGLVVTLSCNNTAGTFAVRDDYGYICVQAGTGDFDSPAYCALYNARTGALNYVSSSIELGGAVNISPDGNYFYYPDANAERWVFCQPETSSVSVIDGVFVRFALNDSVVIMKSGDGYKAYQTIDGADVTESVADGTLPLAAHEYYAVGSDALLNTRVYRTDIRTGETKDIFDGEVDCFATDRDVSCVYAYRSGADGVFCVSIATLEGESAALSREIIAELSQAGGGAVCTLGVTKDNDAIVFSYFRSDLYGFADYDAVDSILRMYGGEENFYVSDGVMSVIFSDILKARQTAAGKRLTVSEKAQKRIFATGYMLVEKTLDGALADDGRVDRDELADIIGAFSDGIFAYADVSPDGSVEITDRTYVRLFGAGAWAKTLLNGAEKRFFDAYHDYYPRVVNPIHSLAEEVVCVAGGFRFDDPSGDGSAAGAEPDGRETVARAEYENLISQVEKYLVTNCDPDGDGNVEMTESDTDSLVAYLVSVLKPIVPENSDAENIFG